MQNSEFRVICTEYQQSGSSSRQENLHGLDFNTLEQRIPCDVKSTTPCDGYNILLSHFFLLLFSSRVREGLITG